MNMVWTLFKYLADKRDASRRVQRCIMFTKYTYYIIFYTSTEVAKTFRTICCLNELSKDISKGVHTYSTRNKFIRSLKNSAS